MRKLAMWIINNIPIGKLAPYVFGYAIGMTNWKEVDNHPLNSEREKAD